jgi:hypothetical protein
MVVEVAMGHRCCWSALSLVFGAKSSGAIGTIRGGGHLLETDLTYVHTGVQRDRQTRDIRKFERDVAAESGIYVAGSGMDKEPKAAQARLALESRDEIVWQPHRLIGGAKHKLARMQHKGFVVWHLHLFGEILLVGLHIDDASGVIAEDPEQIVEAQINRTRLNVGVQNRIDNDPSRSQLLTDRPIAENHAVTLVDWTLALQVALH